MNATQPYGPPAPHHGYVDAHHHGPPTTAAPPYGHYGVQVQPPMLPPAVSSYSHGYYPYAASQPAPSSHFSQPMSLAHMTSGSPTNGPPSSSYDNRPFDNTGQVPPSNGPKPKITATLWEDEGTICFQVEVDGICVARRSDNAMINGTKLLNVARMTRGRRDGILKSEKHRKVIKIGPMHLKGVWIPFERALEFANKEKITEQLYPLFVHNVEQHLHQTQLPQGTAGLTGHRRADSRNDMYVRTSATQTPAIQQTSVMPSPISIGPAAGRPGIDRAQTFPTPPTSASTVGLGSSGGSYGEWSGHPMSAQPLHVEATLNNHKSMPTTPATTPPDNMHLQYPAGPPAFDSRPIYSAPPPQHHSPYTMPPGAQYAYAKADMAPPMRAQTIHESVLPPKEEDEANSSPSYTSETRAYTFQAQPGAQQHEQGQAPTTVEGYRNSPVPGRSTPRTLSGYATPQQHVRGPSMAGNTYPMGGPQTPQSYYPVGGNDKKRHREDDDDSHEAKRQKSIHDSGIGSHRATPVAMGRPQSMIPRHQ